MPFSLFQVVCVNTSAFLHLHLPLGWPDEAIPMHPGRPGRLTPRRHLPGPKGEKRAGPLVRGVMPRCYSVPGVQSLRHINV